MCTFTLTWFPYRDLPHMTVPLSSPPFFFDRVIMRNLYNFGENDLFFVFRNKHFLHPSPPPTYYVDVLKEIIGWGGFKQRCTHQFTQHDFQLENITKDKLELMHSVWLNKKGFALNFMPNKSDEKSVFLGFFSAVNMTYFHIFWGALLFSLHALKIFFLFCNLFLSAI